MNIYGYAAEALLSLDEITFHVTEKELEQLIDFFEYSLAEMKLHGEDFGHSHFSDIKLSNKKPDVIISKSPK